MNASLVQARSEQIWFLDTLITIRVGHHDGGDGISILESRAPFRHSPPLHVHHTEDEVFQVLEGELRLRVGGDELRAVAGDVHLAPKGVPHTFRVESEAGARWLVTTARGDFERFVRELGGPAETPELPPHSGPPTPEQVTALASVAEAHRIELVGPPLA